MTDSSYQLLTAAATKAIEQYKPSPAPNPAQLAEFVKETVDVILKEAEGSLDPAKLVQAYTKVLKRGIEVVYERRSWFVRFFLGDRAKVVKRLSGSKGRAKKSRSKPSAS